MARIQSLSILTQDEGREYLSELYGKVIENVQKELVSVGMKNMDLSGDPTSGTVEAKRFVNATSQAYGTARAAGAGNKIKAKPVTVAIDTDREIVEELEEKDVTLYGVDGVLERRARNHTLRMAAELDKAFFTAAAADAVAVNIPADTAVEDELEMVIQECENTQNDFVDGVPRSMMHFAMSTAYYGKVRNNLDKQTRSNVDTAAEEFYTWHGVETKSCVHLPAGIDYLLIVDGAVAQPVMPRSYTAEKIPLSDAYGVCLFFYYGTKVVTPDLIFKKAAYKASTDTSVVTGKTYYTLSEGVYTAVASPTGNPSTSSYYELI